MANGDIPEPQTRLQAVDIMLFKLLSLLAAGGIVGGFLYFQEFDIAKDLAILVIGGMLGLANVNGKK